MAAVLTLAVGVAAFGIAPDTALETVATEVVTRELGVPAFADPGEALAVWREERIQRGDSIAAVLARLGIDDPAALAFVRTDSRARSLYQLRLGRSVRAEVDEVGSLLRLRYLVSPSELLSVERKADDFIARIDSAPLETRLQIRSAEIQSSLFGAADAAGVPDAVTTQLAEIFSADIDFYHDLRRGDRFTVVYEVMHVDGEPVRTGRVVAAEFNNAGKRLRALWWQAPGGNGGYYADDGRTLRKAFLRSPMEFSRMTSGFSLARLHPLLNVWRAHKGVDYAAPTGTPIRVTGDGKIAFAGTQGGYGNVIVVQHQGVYSTLYAHLSRFAPGMRAGSRVSQGEVIGYVGQTGWATGPHLHYEFRVNNEQQDPMRIALPQAQPVAPEHRELFVAATSPLAARIDLVRGLRVATAD